jgi:hypothetical protein
MIALLSVQRQLKNVTSRDLPLAMPIPMLFCECYFPDKKDPTPGISQGLHTANLDFIVGTLSNLILIAPDIR